MGACMRLHMQPHLRAGEPQALPACTHPPHAPLLPSPPQRHLHGDAAGQRRRGAAVCGGRGPGAARGVGASEAGAAGRGGAVPWWSRLRPHVRAAGLAGRAASVYAGGRWPGGGSRCEACPYHESGLLLLQGRPAQRAQLPAPAHGRAGAAAGACAAAAISAVASSSVPPAAIAATPLTITITLTPAAAITATTAFAAAAVAAPAAAPATCRAPSGPAHHDRWGGSVRHMGQAGWSPAVPHQASAVHPRHAGTLQRHPGERWTHDKNTATYFARLQAQGPEQCAQGELRSQAWPELSLPLGWLHTAAAAATKGPTLHVTPPPQAAWRTRAAASTSPGWRPAPAPPPAACCTTACTGAVRARPPGAAHRLRDACTAACPPDPNDPRGAPAADAQRIGVIQDPNVETGVVLRPKQEGDTPSPSPPPPLSPPPPSPSPSPPPPSPPPPLGTAQQPLPSPRGLQRRPARPAPDAQTTGKAAGGGGRRGGGRLVPPIRRPA